MVLPNQLTILRIILTPVFLFFFLSPEPLYKQISLGIYIIAALTDWYDGWLARKFNYITSWGKFWDPLADKILTSSAFMGFAILGIVPLWMVIIIILRDFIVTGLRAYADYKNISFPTSYYAKWKTFIQMAFLYYLLLVYTGMYTKQIYTGNEELFSILMNEYFIYLTMLIITIITFHSGVQYIFMNRILIIKLLRNAD
ncbi:MAG: CDP-diacylglycerol--glycerol-3-phosphate 3-phosphatidyltransferase [Ignavibacteria bacterium RBG_16_34_14]|nr:MAG: CDP-diacylglycerol--glycerol-3-phosphate 3-phosphatidyltransferase [Ignavibacteria bacterium RBG_16_34_14]